MISDPVKKYHYQIILKLQIFTFKDNIIQNNINSYTIQKRTFIYTNNESIQSESYQQQISSRKSNFPLFLLYNHGWKLLLLTEGPKMYINTTK